MKKSIFVICFGSFVTILFLIYTILSFSAENDGWGQDISMDMDYAVMTLVGVIIIIIGCIELNAFKKQKSSTQNTMLSYGIIGITMTFYPLGNAFKAIAKKSSSSTIAEYFIWAGFGAFILVFVVNYFLEQRRTRK